MSFTNLTPSEAHEKTKEGFVYLDVRTAEEFKAGHPCGAVNIPLLLAGILGRKSNPDFMKQVQERFPKNSKLVIGCASGGRSASACALLSSLGYECLFNVAGGFSGSADQAGWKTLGLPCATGQQ